MKDRKQYYREYYFKNKERKLNYGKEYFRNHKEEFRARKVKHNNIKRECYFCGKIAVFAHHFNYLAPELVVKLCRSCHLKLHAIYPR